MVQYSRHGNVFESLDYSEIDRRGEEVALKAGDWLRIAPAGKRQFFAAADSAIKYVCIQVRQNSLEGYTMTDAVM